MNINIKWNNELLLNFDCGIDYFLALASIPSIAPLITR